MLTDPTLCYTWALTSPERVSQYNAASKRTTTIEADTVNVTLGRDWAKTGDLHVAVEGRVVRRDGEYGAGTRTIRYSNSAKPAAQSLTQLPGWLLPYIDQVKLWEGNRVIF